MIGKARSIAYTGAAIDYGIRKDNAYELSREGVVGETAREIQAEFALFQKLNHNCKNNTLSVVLSPDIRDGQQLSDQALKEITQDYLKGMGLEDRQHVAYVHQDKAHKHIHLYVNRIKENGKAYNDSWIGKKSQRVADQVAKERGLVRAKEVELNRQLGLKQTKEQIKGFHLEVMKARPKDFESYVSLMKTKGVTISPTINKAGQLQGFRAGLGDTMLKASQIWRGMTLANIQPHFAIARKLTKGLGELGHDQGGYSR